MKISTLLCLLLIVPVSFTYAQSEIWQLQLEARGEKPIEWWNKRKTGYTAEFEQAIAEVFQPNGKKTELQEQLLLSKNRTKASNLHTKSFTYYQYPERYIFSFLQGDDMIMKDKMSDMYKVVSRADLKSLKNDDAYLLIDEQEDTKELEGYICKKYILTFGESGLGEVKYTAWCATELPAYATEVLPFGYQLPGAIFQLDLSDEDGIMGFTVTEVKKLPAGDDYFDLPANAEIVELTPLDDAGMGDTDQALENSFRNALSLDSGIQWFQDVRDGLSVIGIKKGNGEVLLPAIYQSAEGVSDAVVAVTDVSQQYWLINTSGKLLNEIGYNHFLPIDNAIYSYKTDTECGLGNLDGEIVIDQLEDIQPLNSDYVFAKKGGQYGVMDLKGTFILPPTYHTVKWNSNGELNLLEKSGDTTIKTISASDFIRDMVK
jgi:hypothetical protein